MTTTAMPQTSSPLRHLLHACTALTLLASPTLAQLDCATAAQVELARLIDQGTATPQCDTASPGQICAASGHPGPCTLQADCTGTSIQADCTDPPAGTYGSYGDASEETECCIVFYTDACGTAAPAEAQLQGRRRRLAEDAAEGGCEPGAGESAAMCLQSCGGSDADLGAADGAPTVDLPDSEADKDELPVVIGFARKGGGGRGGGRSSGGSRSRSTPAFGGHDSGAAQQGAAAGAVFAGLVAALAAAL